MSARLAAKAIVDLIGGVRATVWATIALLAVCGFGIRSCQLSSEREENATASHNIDLWQQADHNNRIAISHLKQALQSWTDMAEADARAGAAAEERLRAENERITRERDNAQKRLEALYAKNPAARQWSRAGLPAGVSDILLDDAVPAKQSRNR